jgi:hypothetical protein
MDRAGKPSDPPMKVSFPSRGDRPVARSARRTLWKPVEASEKRASPADAFAPKLLAPGPRPKHSANVTAKGADTRSAGGLS